MVLDSHTHAWGPSTESRPWENDHLADRMAALDVPDVYTADRLLADMDAAGIDRAVLVGYPIYDWRDNRYTVEAVGDHDRLLGVGMLDPLAEDSGAALRELMAGDGMVGVRLGALFDPGNMWSGEVRPEAAWLRDAIEAQEFWAAARDTDALVQLYVHHDQLDQVVELVDRYPELTYAVDHYALADVTKPPDKGCFVTFAELADHENVLVKVSATPHVSGEEFPYRDVHDHVRWLLAEFGRERVVWGSDYPYVSDDATYEQTLDWLDYVDGLSGADRRWLTHRAFARAVAE